MKRNFTILVALMLTVSLFAQEKKVLYYTTQDLTTPTAYEKVLRDSLEADTNFIIERIVNATQFLAMSTSADSFADYDLVVICESGGSADAVPYGKTGANFPKPTLCLEPYAPGKPDNQWFGAKSQSTNKGVQSPVGPCGKMVVWEPDHEILKNMVDAEGDTIVWTTEKNDGDIDADAHVRRFELDTLTTADAALTDNAVKLASNVWIADTFGIEKNGFLWAVEENTTTKRMVIMGLHANFLKGATADYYQLMKYSAMWLCGIDIPDEVGTKDMNVNMVGLNVFPNPVANGRFNIQFNQKVAGQAEIGVYNIAGQEMIRFAHNGAAGVNTVTVSTDDLSSGMYFVSVNTLQGKAVQKLIVK